MPTQQSLWLRLQTTAIHKFRRQGAEVQWDCRSDYEGRGGLAGGNTKRARESGLNDYLKYIQEQFGPHFRKWNCSSFRAISRMLLPRGMV